MHVLNTTFQKMTFKRRQNNFRKQSNFSLNTMMFQKVQQLSFLKCCIFTLPQLPYSHLCAHNETHMQR